MKLLLLFSLFVCVPPVFTQANRPQFSKYPAAVYKGRIHRPKWIHHVKGDEWRDSQNKLVRQTYINFAGKYFVAGHSLGTGGRYYSMTDVSSGRELDLLVRFATAEPIPTLRDGREFLTVIYVRSESRLIVAQYLIDYMMKPDPECRERSFLFNGRRVKPITKLTFICRKLEE